MKVYGVSSDVSLRMLSIPDETWSEKMDFRGEPVHWDSALPCQYYEEEAPYSNFPDCSSSHALATDRKAREVLQEYLTGNEILKTNLDDICIINILSVIDCLDSGHTKLDYFQGRLTGILRYSFFEEKLEDFRGLFIIPESAMVFVCDHSDGRGFIDKYYQADLKGLEFEEMWDSESLLQESAC